MTGLITALRMSNKLNRAKRYLELRIDEIKWQEYVAGQKRRNDEIKDLQDAADLLFKLSWRV